MVREKTSKKAWLRIVEAFIAILIIMGAVLLIISRQKAQTNNEEEIIRLQRDLLDYISKDNDLRAEILNNNTDGVNREIEKIIPPWLNYSTRICLYNEICSNPIGYIPKEVYASEVLIVANLTYMPTNSTKLKIFFWEK